MEQIVNRRLLIAKEFYLNANNLSSQTDSLSKMISIHNFHIAIEITIKSILLKYEIRSEKTLNIDFETMLSEIDNHSEFKSQGKRLPYRQEVRNLNQMRNMVQHHAVEPDQSSIDDWRLFSRRFLEATFQSYFNVEFNAISRVSFVADKLLQDYLSKSKNLISQQEYETAACFTGAAFEYAEVSISTAIPESSSSFFVTSGLRHSGMDIKGLEEAFQKTHKRINEGILYASILASGVTLSDYKKFKEATPSVMIAINGYPNFHIWRKEFTCENVQWACEFVTNCIIKWQSQGLRPCVPENLIQGAVNFLDSKE